MCHRSVGQLTKRLTVNYKLGGDPAHKRQVTATCSVILVLDISVGKFLDVLFVICTTTA
jgi:hypothetical protein